MSEKLEEIFVEEIKSVVTELSEETGLINPTYSFQRGTSLGDNYLGEILNVIVKGNNEYEKEKKLNLIVKCAPRSADFRSKFPIRTLYEREIFAYEKVFKLMLQVQIENDITDVFYPFAVCYKTILKEGLETLIMKNLKPLGYKMQDRTKPLDYDHVLLVMKFYGKLHALSFAIRDQYPKKFRKIADFLTEDVLFCNNNIPKDYFDIVTKPVCSFLKGTLLENFEKWRMDLQNILIEEMSEEAAGQYSVISHGDCWINNFLFKYQNTENSNKPTKMIFLDWQLSKMSSPVVDLSYFICVCTDKNLRNEHYFKLIDEYYLSFSTFLKKLGSDPDILFPREIFEDHLKKFMGYGLYMALTVLKLMFSEKDEIPDIKNMSSDQLENFADQAVKPIKSTNEYEKRLVDILTDVKSYGYVRLQ